MTGMLDRDAARDVLNKWAPGAPSSVVLDELEGCVLSEPTSFFALITTYYPRPAVDAIVEPDPVVNVYLYAEEFAAQKAKTEMEEQFRREQDGDDLLITTKIVWRADR